MKTMIYNITYTSYDELDNYLHSEARVTDRRIDAIKLFEEWCDNARENAKGEDDEYDINQSTKSLTGVSREYKVSRAVGTENGYQAAIKLSVTEL